MLAKDIDRVSGLLGSFLDAASKTWNDAILTPAEREDKLRQLLRDTVTFISGKLASKGEFPFVFVSAMNEAFGNPKGNPLDYDGPWNNAWTRLQSQCKNIPKEYEELQKAFAERHMDAVRDALCDIMVFALGAYHFTGYDADRDMQSVISAVLTRFCADEAQLAATKAHFDSLGLEYYAEGEFPFVRLKSSKDQGDGEYPKGKFLKSVGYRQPVFYQVPRPDPKAEAPPARKFFGQETTQAMQEDREKHVATEDAKKAKINEMVALYRTQLEELMFGLPPFDPNSNNLEGIKPALGA